MSIFNTKAYFSILVFEEFKTNLYTLLYRVHERISARMNWETHLEMEV